MREAVFLPTPGTVAMRFSSPAATTSRRASDSNKLNTERASLATDAQMATRRSKAVRSSRVAKP